MRRDPDMPSEAFTGPFYVVDGETKLAVQSEQTLERAQHAMDVLNQHNEGCGHKARYYVKECKHGHA